MIKYIMDEINFAEIVGFDWNEGNLSKNWKKHRVTNQEAQELFFNNPLVLKDEKHMSTEERFNALGETNNNRFLFVTFTRRGNLIRIISARDANKKERKTYEQS